jgi:BirA family biotin operon repressor/biotin-[acetyl-CoA-carboxylase] ligase
VVRTLRSTAGLQAGLKWPNDVLVGPMPGARKVAGILAEVATSRPPALVLGVGLNVTTTESDLPVPTATSLRIEGSATTDRDTLLRALLRELAAVLTRWQEAGGDVVGSGLAAEVREVCLTLGRPVRVELPGGQPLVGVAEELADDGRLVVRTPDGAVPVPAGDVVHLRDGEAGGGAVDGR